MERDEALAELERVRAAMHQAFEDDHGTHRSRLEALDSALGTAGMHVSHLFDEEQREADLAVRILNRETVHGSDEARDHSGRSIEHMRAIARAAGAGV